MKYIIDKKEQYTMLQPQVEKFDSTQAPEFKSSLITLHSEGVSNLVIDLSAVKYIDSSGLSALLVGNRLIQEEGGLFILTGLNEHVKKLIEISQLNSVLTIFDKIEEVVDAIFLHEIERDLKSSEEE